MYAGSGRSGDFAGDPLYWLAASHGSIISDKSRAYITWTGAVGLPGDVKWIVYVAGVIVSHDASSGLWINLNGTLQNVAIVPVPLAAWTVDYDPLGGHDVNNLDWGCYD